MKLVSRAEWGARPATSRTRFDDVPDGLTVHWEGPRMGSFPHSSCAGKVRGIQLFHMQSRGWADIAYSYLVCPHGFIYEGRGQFLRTAANGTNQGNANYWAVCYLGGTGDPFTDEAKTAILELKAYLRTFKLNGHRDHKQTECPGNIIYSWVQQQGYTPPKSPPAEEELEVTKEELQVMLNDAVKDITGGRRLRDENGQVIDSDPANVSNADLLTALEKGFDRVVAAINSKGTT